MMTKDQKLKSQVFETMTSVNKAMVDLSKALEVVNNLNCDQKQELTDNLNNVAVSAKNLRKFTDKLNKRFLIFRLMF